MTGDITLNSVGKVYKLYLPSFLSQQHDSTAPFWTGGLFHVADQDANVSQWSFKIGIEDEVRRRWNLSDSDLLNVLREIGSLLFQYYCGKNIDIAALKWAQFNDPSLRVFMVNEVPAQASPFIDVLKVGQWEDPWLVQVQEHESDNNTNAIKRLRVGGFKRLLQLDLELRPLTVIIGANGVGKTSLLDALSLLSASADGSISRFLSELGGASEVLSRAKAKFISLGADLQVGGHELTYQIEIEPSGQSYGISREELSQQLPNRSEPLQHIASEFLNARYFDPSKGTMERPSWPFVTYESALSQVLRTHRLANECRNLLTSTEQYHGLDVGMRAPIKLPQVMKPVAGPGINGEDLVPFLYNLRETDARRFELIEDTIRAAFHAFENLNFPSAAAGMLSMTWKDKNFKSPLYMHQLSEGTLRFLWLVAILQSPSLTAVTMIDEPEVSLHPELLSLFAELIRESAQRTQVVVATHSDRLIRFLRPEEVLVMDTGDAGFSTATWADSLDIEKWLKDYTLDEVWRTGELGGRS
jgi:predicted ATPase